MVNFFHSDPRSSKNIKFLVIILSVKCYVTFINFSPYKKQSERKWVFATNANFIIPKFQQPDDAYLSYFKLTLLDPPKFIVWNIYGLRYLVLKKLGFKNPSLWQNSIPFHLLFSFIQDKCWSHSYSQTFIIP